MNVPAFKIASADITNIPLIKHIAEKKGFDDSLMLDSNGYVAESTGANIFFVKNNKLYTPIADCFLNGITRQTVIKLAKKNNIKIIEKRILPRELLKADEIFLTGTVSVKNLASTASTARLVDINDGTVYQTFNLPTQGYSVTIDYADTFPVKCSVAGHVEQRIDFKLL